MAGKIISVFNNKGGIGKTTTALAIGHGLAKRKIKTLIIDIDPQGNASDPLVGTDPKNTIFDVINETKSIQQCIKQTKTDKNLYCLPSTEDLFGFEAKLIAMGQDGFSFLDSIISDYCRNNFDAIIIDCPPNFGIFIINALFCSDFAIIPTEAGSRNSIKGLRSTKKFIAEIADSYNHRIELFKILITKIDMRTTIGKDYISKTKKTFGELVFKQHIPACVDFKYAENLHQTIFQNYNRSAGARAYRHVVLETMSLLELKNA